MKVTIPICYKKDNETYKRTIQFVNPNVSDDDLRELVRNLNSLTDNNLVEALKVVTDFVNRGSGGEITHNDINKIFDGTYTIDTIAGGITENDIDKIFDDSYIIDTISGGITEDDIHNIF